MDLIGIENEAEFLPSGTLSDVLKEDLLDITARWSGFDKEAHPVERLASIAAPTVEALRQVRNASDANRRHEIARKAHHALLEALGYTWRREATVIARPGLESLAPPPLIPLVSRVADSSGQDALWVVEAPIPDAQDEAADPLGATFEVEQFPPDAREAALLNRTIESVLSEGIFDLPNGPRHVLVLGLSQLVLIDERKWPARSALRFDLQEILSRADRDTLTVMACLISREARVPEQGTPIAERLEEEAQRNANAVTTSLKGTVRDAIELLGQEVLDVTGGKHQGVWIDGPELSRECLRYMYRLLFLFYAEANPRLNLLDLRNPIYATGYSLEMLRDLESVPLRSPADRKGTFLWQSLQKTLNLLYTGLDLADEENGTGLLLLPVRVSLLDPESTPILKGLQLRNEAIQKVIRHLSLRSSGKGTGRISYAKLGIGQLGAVYETLISFTGVVAKTDLIELKPRKGRSGATEDRSDAVDADKETDEEADEGVLDTEAETEEVFRRDKVDLLAPSWFVPRSRIEEFDAEDIVFKGAEARIYPKGTFIYRLAGRDREKSASFYTPEPLARLLVKHALMERCQGLTADQLLELKILEPAMGSAAFLVETVNQLADLYIERAQQEANRTIPQDQIVMEKQRIRAYIADRNCFGVDLNPIAVELGAISLWLNSLHAGDFSPWFGDQLHAGNSLVGARRATYGPALLSAKAQKDLWLNEKPEEIGWRKRLPEGHVWQWLLPAKDMANFDKHKSIAPFAEDAQDKIKAWRRGGFFKKLEPHEISLVQKLSRIAEALFDEVAEKLAESRDNANDKITLWPGKEMPGNSRMDFHEKKKMNDQLIGADHAANTLPYRRLKTAMDAWCALWLWPLDKVDLLPDRAEFLQGMAMVLEGGFAPDGSLASPSTEEFADPAPKFPMGVTPESQEQDSNGAANKPQGALFRETNVEALIETFPWLGVTVEVAERERFVHFDLIFADVMKARGGFDVIVGNPPWAKPAWNDALVLADLDPLYAGLSASDAKKALPEALPNAPSTRRGGRLVSATEAFLQDFVSTRGAIEMTSSEVMNPFVGGGDNNLYRCFIDLSFRLVAPQGCAALIHQDGHLGDPRSGEFRRHWYRRIRKHFSFINKITAKIFAEVSHELRFCLNVYAGTEAPVSFDQFTYAYLPSQVEDSYSHDGTGPVGGLIGKDKKWNVAGHKKRIIKIEEETLREICELNGDSAEDFLQTCFLQPFSENVLDILSSVSRVPTLEKVIKRVENRSFDSSSLDGKRMWYSETDLRESDNVSDGTIVRKTEFRPLEETVIQGPHIFVGNPLFKTPRRVYKTNASYDWIDHRSIDPEYVPRSNYGFSSSEARKSIVSCRWNSSIKHADLFRVAVREMTNPTSERSLISAIIPRGVSHTNTIRSLAFSKDRDLLNFQALSSSILLDCIHKMSGGEHFKDSDAKKIPWIGLPDTALFRVLQLSCLTKAYAELWNINAPKLHPQDWSTSHPTLPKNSHDNASKEWNPSFALRTEYSRRWALIEIDVLVAQSFGLSLDQLLEVYEIYFPVMQKKESSTYYDGMGNIAWISATGSNNIGLLDANGQKWTRSAWNDFLASGKNEVSCVVEDDTRPDGPHKVTRRFVGPFTTCDRIKDYKIAWNHFERLESQEAA